jgi:arabinan endo-1,5-alpha-L-arabinosidase
LIRLKMKQLKIKKNNMKRLFNLMILMALLAILYSCTDVGGDGIDTVIWNGSTLPEGSSYRNPVWEPDLAKPSVFRGPTQFYAFGDEKEWSAGFKYVVPVLSSSNLMNWNISGQAFRTRPEWNEGKISSVSCVFSKTLGTYYMFYQIGDAGIGSASAKAPQGPYTDYGKLIDKDMLGSEYCHEPFLIQSGLSFYLFYETEEGIWGQELTIVRNTPPTLKGSAFKIAGTGITGIYVFRKSSDSFYLFGTVGDDLDSEIYIARASNIKGPYLDKDGNDLMTSQGTLLVSGDTEGGFEAPGHVGGVFTDREDYEWILFQATDISKTTISSGETRRPLILSRIEWDDTGWPAALIQVKGGWNTPKFKL